MKTRILAWAGSSRKESFNRKLLAVAVTGAEEAGAEVTTIDLGDYPMPLVNQDLEAETGIPENGLKFKRLLLEHDALLIASPEYNGSISPLLKNALDWASRAETDDEIPLAAYRGKTAAILAASPGALGGLRGLVVLRMLLGNLGITVLPEQQTLPRADQALNEDGSPISRKKEAAVRALGAKLARTTEKLKDQASQAGKTREE